MIDIHNHTLFGVDDGPDSVDISLAMLQEARTQGITDVILTPHYRKHMFKYDREAIERNLELLKTAAAEAGIDVSLYLGCEIHFHEDMAESLRRRRVNSLAGTDYVLTEYSYEDSFEDILETTRMLRSAGYRPIIAHVERIGCLRKKPKSCVTLREDGAWIQCNAMAVLGMEGWGTERFCGKLMRMGCLDLIASDTHNNAERPNLLKQARDKVAKKYGEEYADVLTEGNPRRILNRIPGHATA